jgi:HD superfamily phosphohydrolase YqeK
MFVHNSRMSAGESFPDVAGAPSSATSRTGIEAHCQRVAVLALEIARAIVPPIGSADALAQAALLHHAVPMLFDQPAMDRLLSDLLPSAVVASTPEPGADRVTASSEVRGFLTILRAFHDFPSERPRDAKVRTLAEVLVVSNLLDEQMEFVDWEGPAASNISGVLEELAPLFQPKVVEAAAKILFGSRAAAQRDGPSVLPRDGIARETLAGFLNRRLTCAKTIADLAARDPVIAADFLKAANAASPGSMRGARSIRQAIAGLGVAVSRRLLLGLAVRPLFAPAGPGHEWRHSLWMADFLAGCAEGKGFMEPEEAMLLGLVHDIGCIATQELPVRTLSTLARLSRGGFALRRAESLLLGTDHGEAGAAILSRWGFPDHMVNAVRFHHRPAESDSPLAAGLYAAGFWADDNEDLPSHRHLDASLKRLRFTIEELSKVQPAEGALSRMLSRT